MGPLRRPGRGRGSPPAAPLKRLPWFTLALVAAGAWIQGAGETARALEYHRAAVDGGEGWRVITCHLTHWTPRMAFADLGALLVLGGWLERRRPMLAIFSVVAGALLAGTGIHMLMPRMLAYRGASGIVSAIFVALVIDLVRREERPALRRLVAGAAALFVAKLLFEVLSGRAVAAGTLPPGVVVSPEVHLLGAVAGFMAWRFHHLGGIRRAALRASGGAPRSGSSS